MQAADSFQFDEGEGGQLSRFQFPRWFATKCSLFCTGKSYEC